MSGGWDIFKGGKSCKFCRPHLVMQELYSACNERAAALRERGEYVDDGTPEPIFTLLSPRTGGVYFVPGYKGWLYSLFLDPDKLAELKKLTDKTYYPIQYSAQPDEPVDYSAIPPPPDIGDFKNRYSTTRGAAPNTKFLPHRSAAELDAAYRCINDLVYVPRWYLCVEKPCWEITGKYLSGSWENGDGYGYDFYIDFPAGRSCVIKIYDKLDDYSDNPPEEYPVATSDSLSPQGYTTVEAFKSALEDLEDQLLDSVKERTVERHASKVYTDDGEGLIRGHRDRCKARLAELKVDLYGDASWEEPETTVDYFELFAMPFLVTKWDYDADEPEYVAFTSDDPFPEIAQGYIDGSIEISVTGHRYGNYFSVDKLDLEYYDDPEAAEE